MNLIVSLHLNKNDKQPLYYQLYQQIKNLILNQAIKPGEKLPSIRYLAKMMEINNSTVVNAYRLLEQEGLVQSHTGSGTYVSFMISSLLPASSMHENQEKLTESKIQVEIPQNAINFASLVPSPDLFPVKEFKTILNSVLDRDKGDAFTYQDSQGYFPLRQAISEYLKKSGIQSHPDNIQVVSGAQQGIDLVAKALTRYGDCVITENPTYIGAIAALRSRGVNIIPVDISREGININELKKAIKKYNPRLVYVMPNYQNPSGYSYDDKHKLQILDIAAKENLYIVEDDSFAELCFDVIQRSPLKKFDIHNRVIYIMSLSKIMVPGLRVAFVLAPKILIPDLITAKHTSDISTSGLMQRSLDLFLRENMWEKHMKQLYKIYQERYNILLSSMQQHFPSSIEWYPPGGGLNIWVKLPYGCSSYELYQLCLQQQVLISPGGLFYPNKEDVNAFRLSIAAPSTEEIKEGIIKISRCLFQLLPHISKTKGLSPLI